MKLTRRYSVIVAAFIMALAGRAWSIEQEAGWLVEARGTHVNALRSWTDGGPGKLRDSGDDTSAAVRLALDYGLYLEDTISLHVALDGYAGTDSNGGLTEGWISWNPIPSSPRAYSVRAGSLIPPFSMEHVDTGWTSPYMPTGSVLNSWIGEELRTNAVELTVQRRGSLARSPHTLTLRAAAFLGNDTSGTLLSWRGWAANDRVTPLGDSLRLPDRPAFQAGGPFPGVDSTDPFLEIDDRPGFYATAAWRFRSTMEIALGHYDNRADPLAFGGGQAGWRTKFSVAGLHWRPARGTDVIAQYLEGNTLVGRRGEPRSADNDFAAWYVLASRRWGDQRFAVRYERFEVRDLDATPLDDNREEGHGWGLSWQYEWRDGLTAGAEYLRLDYNRPELAGIDGNNSVDEEQLRVNLRYRF